MLSHQDYDGMFIVEDPVDARFVLCELTGVRLSKNKVLVNTYVNGKRFKEAMSKIQVDDTESW